MVVERRRQRKPDRVSARRISAVASARHLQLLRPRTRPRRRRLAEAADRRVAHRLAELGQQRASSASDAVRGWTAPWPAAAATPPGALCRRGTARTGRTISSRKNSAMRQQRVAADRRCRRTPSPRRSRASRRPRARLRRSAASSSASGPTNIAGGAAEQDRLQRPAARARRRPASMQLAQRDPNGDFVEARPRDLARTGRTARVPVDAPVPTRGPGRAALEHDVEHVDQRLDVVDDRRLAEQADLHRERRLVRGSPRLPSIELNSAVSSPQM